MRVVLSVFVLLGLPLAAIAEDADLSKCEKVEAWFNMAVAARADGAGEGKVRRLLRQEMGERTAAEELAKHVFALPEALLTEEVGAAARAQCEAL